MAKLATSLGAIRTSSEPKFTLSPRCVSLYLFMCLVFERACVTDEPRSPTDGILGFSVYTLAYTVPKLRDPVRQRLTIYVWTGVLLAMASVLFRVFQTKQPGCARFSRLTRLSRGRRF